LINSGNILEEDDEESMEGKAENEIFRSKEIQDKESEIHKKLYYYSKDELTPFKNKFLGRDTKSTLRANQIHEESKSKLKNVYKDKPDSEINKKFIQLMKPNTNFLSSPIISKKNESPKHHISNSNKRST